MELRQCGRSHLKLPALGVGCWAFGGGAYWGDCSQQDVNAVVRRSVELGINYFDTAEAYNDGRSEESLGQALKGLPRDSLVIGTKVSPSNCYGEALPKHCELSLAGAHSRATARRAPRRRRTLHSRASERSRRNTA